MKATQALGATITIIGLILLIYALTVGALDRVIGSPIAASLYNGTTTVVTHKVTLTVDNTTTTTVVRATLTGGVKLDASPAWMDSRVWAAILGWFFILTGPALWQGEVPTAIKRKLEEARRGVSGR